MTDSLLWLKTQAMGQLFVSRCLKSLRTIYGVWRLEQHTTGSVWL